MTTNSTPITGLPESSGRIAKSDLMLMSKIVDGEYESRRFSYSTLTSNISIDILPLVPKQTFPIYDSELPLNSRKDNMSYSTNSVTKFYDQTSEQITNLNNNKLDKNSTTAQTVKGQVTFNDKLLCITSTASSGTEAVNIDYLNNYMDGLTSPYLKEFWVDADGYGWYKLYSNGWLEQGGVYGKQIPTDTAVTITLYKSFKNTTYQVQSTLRYSKTTGMSNVQPACIAYCIKDKQNFYLLNDHNKAQNSGATWEAKGLAS